MNIVAWIVLIFGGRTMMKINYIRIGVLLLVGVSLSTCIDQIDFEVNEPDGLLVVDGTVSNYLEKHRIRLTRSGDLKDRIFSPEQEAEIILFDENGEIDNYIELEDGWYELANEFAGKSGSSYHIEIRTKGGKMFRSRPETIQPHMELTGDDLSFEVLWEEDVAPNGTIQNKPFVKLFVDFSIPDFEEGPYLRWTVDHIYAIEDLVCGGLDPIEVCYIRPPGERQDVQLFAGEGLVSGSNFKQEVSKRFIDYAFAIRFSFTVNQFMHTREAFEYWTKVDLLANQSGSIFDAPPDRITGNIYNPEDEEELVLGYFAGVSVDTAHQFVINADIIPVYPSVRPLCGIPGFRPFPLPAPCCKCIVHEHSNMVRPDFW